MYQWVSKLPTTNKEIARVGALIRNGAKTFLVREYKLLAIFVAVVAVLIFILLPQPIWHEDSSISRNLFTALAYVAGSIFRAWLG